MKKNSTLIVMAAAALLAAMAASAQQEPTDAILPPLPSDKTDQPTKISTGPGAKPPVDPAIAAAEAARTKGTLEDENFKQAQDILHLLSPVQVQKLTEIEDEMLRASISRPTPVSTTASIPVTTRPGVIPKRILLSDNYATALSIVDATGAPWPILTARIGNKDMYESEAPADPGNIILIAPRRAFGASNLVILLKGASAPITLSLETNREASFYSANLVVDDVGPNARAPTVVQPPEPVDEKVMRQIADGYGLLVPQARAVVLSGDPETTAFISDDRLFIRTPHRLVDPAPVAGFRSGGIGVYEIPASPLITVVTDAGGTIQLTPHDEVLLDAAFNGMDAAARAAGKEIP